MNTSERTIVELKAKVDNLESVRSKLKALGAQHTGTFHQTDTHFIVPKGRLKLQQIDSEKTELIYHERENTSKPKRSDVFVLEISENKAITALLKKILKVKATVKKTREIYWYQRTQIHLDTVDSLGSYVEFERKTLNTHRETERNAQLLEQLMETLGINSEDLEKLSYGDLVSLE